ncbi:MAG: serine/threonine-protein phosphatase [Hahellaceae bacterium]|nr:serine/threonine-protein phosphatase [Hahellaceae bacterium]
MIEAGFATHVGRRSSNQDNALLDQTRGVFAVADGVGGAHAGEEAAALVCTEVRQASLRGQPLTQGILNGHEKLRDLSREKAADQYSATTIACLGLYLRRAEVAWVGDSRVYLSRQGQLLQMTRDHVVDGQNHVLTQALGAPMVKPIEIDHLEMDRQDGDVWLICSDGLYSVVDEAIILDRLMQPLSAQKIADELLDRALRGGADDNVTLVIIRDLPTGVIPSRSESRGKEAKVTEVVSESTLPASSLNTSVGYVRWVVIAVAVALILNWIAG